MGNKIVCGKCGQMIEARGFKVHETFCKGEKKEDHKKVEGSGSVTECHKCGSNDIRRIDEFADRDPERVKMIIKAGYTHVCYDCAEVLK